jgi:hypothetical protein
MARKKQPTDSSGIAPELKPRDVEAKFSSEMLFKAVYADESERKIDIIKAFNWYHRFYGKTDAKEMIGQYLSANQDTRIKQFLRVPDKRINLTIGWLCRASVRNLTLTQQERDRISGYVDVAISQLEPEVTQTEKPKVDIQQAMRDKAQTAAGELEAVFDEFCTHPKATGGKVTELLKQFNVQKQYIEIVRDPWLKKRQEFSLAATDTEIQEGYQQFGKVQLRHISKFIDQVIGEIDGYVNEKQASKKPRVKKAVPVEKLCEKLKFCKEFTDAAAKVSLTSIDHKKLHNCTEAFLFDTKKRKLIHLVAKKDTKITVNRANLDNVDLELSKCKTVRVPASMNDFAKLSKLNARKAYSDIKTVETAASNRTNENLIILSVF